MMNFFRAILIIACIGQLTACSSGRFATRQAKEILLKDSNLLSAHVGISIFNANTNKSIYNHQGDKYFIPASNTKLFTCYAAMKHLGDSLVGLRYYQNDSGTMVFATGDPTLLHPGFRQHPVYDFLKAIKQPVRVSLNWKSKVWGNGWAWNDYDADYMAERSPLPVAGNLLTIEGNAEKFTYYPAYSGFTVTADNHVNGASRQLDSNLFRVKFRSGGNHRFEIPYYTGNGLTNLALLGQFFGTTFQHTSMPVPESISVIYSQHTDSMLKPMMHRSDNFFAEQSLLMVSNEMTGFMNDAKIIDSLLRTDLADLPQKPRWVDGSGLSRYNLFTPQDMVAVLRKMKNEFRWERITTILPSGGEGTLSNYYVDLRNRIFAKTGTLSNNVALSGFLLTKKNQTLVFSVIVNNHMGNTTQIRRAVEKYLTSIAEKY